MEGSRFIVIDTSVNSKNIQCICGFRFHNTMPQYLIRWKSFRTTWESIRKFRYAYDTIRIYNYQCCINIDIHKYVDWPECTAPNTAISPLHDRVLDIRVIEIIADCNDDCILAAVSRTYDDKVVVTNEELIILMSASPKVVVDYFEKLIVTSSSTH